MSELVANITPRNPIEDFYDRILRLTTKSPEEELNKFYLDLFNHLAKEENEPSAVKIGRSYELRRDGLYHNRLRQGFRRIGFGYAKPRLLKEFRTSISGKQQKRVVLLSDGDKFSFEENKDPSQIHLPHGVGSSRIPRHYINDLRTRSIDEWSASDWIIMYLLFKNLCESFKDALPFYLVRDKIIVFKREFLRTVPEIGEMPCSILLSNSQDSRISVLAYNGNDLWRFETEEDFVALKSVISYAFRIALPFVSRQSLSRIVRTHVLGRTIPLKESPDLTSPTVVLDRIKSMVDTVESMGLIDDQSKHVFYATQTFILIKLLSNYSTYRKSPNCSFMINEIDDTIEMIYMVDGDLGKITYDQKIHSLSGIGTGDNVEKFTTVLKICNHFKNMFLKDVL